MVRSDLPTGDIGLSLSSLESDGRVILRFSKDDKKQIIYVAPTTGIYKLADLNHFVFENFEKNLSLIQLEKETIPACITPTTDISWGRSVLSEKIEGIEKEITIIFYPDYELMFKAFSSGEYLYSMSAYKFKIYSWLKRLSNLIIRN